MSAPALLDVSIPMYAAGGEHPSREPCVQTMMEIAAGRLNVVLDAESIQEVLYRFGRLQAWDIGARLAASLFDIVPNVLPVTADDARVSLDLFTEYGPRGVSARDLIHVAVMRNNGLTEVLSTDRHYDVVAGIRRVDPTAPAPRQH